MKSLDFIDKKLGNYYVTTCGRIYKKNKTCYKQLFKNKKTNDGYPTMFVKTNEMDKCFSRTIHRVVALAFIPNLKNVETVDHIDAIKTNNMIQNLRWATRSEQLYNPHYVDKKGVRINCFKVDGTFVKTYRSITEATKDGFSSSVIHKIIHKVPDLRWGKPYFSKSNKGHYFELASVTTISKESKTQVGGNFSYLEKDKDIV